MGKVEKYLSFWYYNIHNTFTLFIHCLTNISTAMKKLMVFFTLAFMVIWINPSVANGPPTSDDAISITIDQPSENASQLFDFCFVPVLNVADNAVFIPVQKADVIRLYCISLSLSYFHPPDAHLFLDGRYNNSDNTLTSHEKGLIFALRYY